MSEATTTATTSHLLSLQHLFSDFLYNPAAATVDWVGSPHAGDQTQRMGIYSNAYRVRLLEILASHYGGVALALGQEEFDALGTAYLAAQPSQYTNIRYFGDALASFIAEATYEWQDKTIPRQGLMELCCFEWALVHAVDAMDAPVVSSEMIAQLSPEEWPKIRLGFHPSVSLLTLKWNVIEFWQAAQQGKPAPEWREAEEPHACLAWRQENTSYYQSLEPIPAKVVGQLMDGKEFGEICDYLLPFAPEEEIPGLIVSTLHFLLPRHTLSQLVLHP